MSWRLEFTKTTKRMAPSELQLALRFATPEEADAAGRKVAAGFFWRIEHHVIESPDPPNARYDVKNHVARRIEVIT